MGGGSTPQLRVGTPRQRVGPQRAAPLPYPLLSTSRLHGCVCVCERVGGWVGEGGGEDARVRGLMGHWKKISNQN